MTYTRDSFQQLSETYSSIVEKKVTYYKGDDRDKETGIPKGAKSQATSKQPKERKQTKPPYEALAASHELQGEVVEAKDEKGLDPEAKKELRNTRSPHLSKIAHTTTDKYKGVHSLSNKRQDVHRKMDGIKKPKAESPRMTKAKKSLASVAPKDDWAESKKDDTYLEPNWEKRKKNNEKARKEMQKDAKDSGYTDIALKASLSKGAGRISEAVKMSKEAWKKTHKDFRNDDEKSPRVVKLNPKTQGTESHPVTFTKEETQCDCDCGKVPCIKCGGDHHEEKKVKLPDMRELPTRVNLVKNKLRAMGLKMSQQLTGDQLLEVARYSIGEATRLKKEQGYQKGGTKKPSGKKDAALSYVLDKIKKEGGVVIGQGSRQQKKVKGAKSDAGTGKYKRAADEKKQTASDAKEMGYGDNVKGYIETKARYGSKENMKSGRGLGT